jgi:hypothetical protein
VLHDLQDRQVLGSLTTILSEFSDTWDRTIKFSVLFNYYFFYLDRIEADNIFI